MKVYMMTDLEGVTGVDQAEQMDFGNEAVYRGSCEKLMLDVNAAVAGAFEGGAEHVAVLDGHGGRNRYNFILDMLDERASYVDRSKQEGLALDDTYDATFAVGTHAMAGTLNGFLDHTQSSTTIFNWYLNGRRIGELAQCALSSAAFGVPLVMVSGDEAACAEARAFFNPVETAAVKQGVGRNRAIAYPADVARARIREAARRSLELVGTARPFMPIMPMEVKVEFNRSDYCDGAVDRPGAERLDARTIRWITSDPGDWHPRRR